MIRTLATTLTIGLAACSQGGSRTPTAPLEPVERATVEIIETEIEIEIDQQAEGEILEDTDDSVLARPFVRITTPMFEADTVSLQLGETVWVKAAPFADSPRLGLIRAGTRIEDRSHVDNDDCETPWIEVAPRGFACVAVDPSDKAPTTRRQRTRAMIGRYAIARKGAVFYKSVAAFEAGTGRRARGDMVRLTGSVTLEDGRKLVKTERGELVESTFVRRLWGSKFRGVDLTAANAPAAPFAFAVHPRNPRRRVVARSAPEPRARVARRLGARAIVAVEAIDGDFVRIAAGQWVARGDLRIVERSIELPAEVAQAARPEQVRWADVDLDQQLVVIYQGRTPIFATLMSSGRRGDETPTGVFRVTRKKVRTTMRSDRSRRQTYSVAVPWSTYFNEGYAFHTAYWHNSFGKARSHGCVNLSPADALTVYKLLGPELPAGWSVVYGHDTHQPGSVVRVRSAEAETVEPQVAVAGGTVRR